MPGGCGMTKDAETMGLLKTLAMHSKLRAPSHRSNPFPMTWKQVIGLSVFFLCIGAALAHFGPELVRADDQTEFGFPAPDPDPNYVKPPRPNQSYACDPLARGNVFDERVSHKAIIWASQSASKLAFRISEDGKQLLLMRAMDVSAGNTDPEEFKITSNSPYYLMAEERFILGVALIIFDVRTMKMVWSFNGQGMLGMKGETVLFQCR
jgi:hypothetical protein